LFVYFARACVCGLRVSYVCGLKVCGVLQPASTRVAARVTGVGVGVAGVCIWIWIWICARPGLGTGKNRWRWRMSALLCSVRCGTMRYDAVRYLGGWVRGVGEKGQPAATGTPWARVLMHVCMCMCKGRVCLFNCGGCEA
jgi:hypothetical protein